MIQKTNDMGKIQKKLTTLDEFIDQQYGPEGTPKRDKFELEAQAFALLRP